MAKVIQFRYSFISLLDIQIEIDNILNVLIIIRNKIETHP